MERYDYRQEVKKDIYDFIADDVNCNNAVFADRDEVEERYVDNNLVIDSDQVTGNASGSYTLNTWEAEENLCHNSGLLDEVLEELDYYSDAESLKRIVESPEVADVIIRCCLVDTLIYDVLDELVRDGVIKYSGE